MEVFEAWQYGVIAMLFIWSGFVRSGLGFGGAALTLPLLLLVQDNPLLFLPIIAVHLLIFGTLTALRSPGSINWPYLRKLLLIIIIPKLAGIAGLLNLSPQFMTGFVYVVTLLYAMSYIFNIKLKGGAYTDLPLLMLGGYMSGASLIGAPLIVAVSARHLAAAELRSTLFVLWLILVLIKMAAFVAVGVDLQLAASVYLLPFAALGHWLGIKLHNQLIEAGDTQFIRVIGIALTVVSVIGLWKLVFVN